MQEDTFLGEYTLMEMYQKQLKNTLTWVLFLKFFIYSDVVNKCYITQPDTLLDRPGKKQLQRVVQKSKACVQ